MKNSNENQEICANCRHKKGTHIKSGKIYYNCCKKFKGRLCLCKKFKPQNQSQNENCGDSPTRQQRSKVVNEERQVSNSWNGNSSDTLRGIFDVSDLDIDINGDRIKFRERQRLKIAVEKVLDEMRETYKDGEVVNKEVSITNEILEELKKRLGIK